MAPLTVTHYSSLPELMAALRKKYHGGALYPMAKRIGVSLGAVQQWDNGMIRQPGVPSLERLARAYDLDLTDLLTLVYGDGGRPLLPLGKAPRRQGRRALGSLLLACAVGTAGWLGWPSPSVAAQADTPCVLQVLENIGNSVSYRTLARWLRAILVPALLPTPCAA